MNTTILIIDSHPVYIDRTISFLKGLTFQNIITAGTGREGIQKAIEHNPEIVILSSMLPDKDSLEVCRAVSNAVACQVVVQTGLFTTPDDERKIKESGADAVVVRQEKDFQPLQDVIEHMLIQA